MTAKVVFGLALMLIASVATANPAGAEPNPFSVLTCSCDGGDTVLHRGTLPEQIDTGIQNGLSDLLGVPD